MKKNISNVGGGAFLWSAAWKEERPGGGGAEAEAGRRRGGAEVGWSGALTGRSVFDPLIGKPVS